jgi:hypothetical protein
MMTCGTLDSSVINSIYSEQQCCSLLRNINHVVENLGFDEINWHCFHSRVPFLRNHNNCNLSRVYIGKVWHDNTSDIARDTVLSLLSLATLGGTTQHRNDPISVTCRCRRRYRIQTSPM